MVIREANINNNYYYKTLQEIYLSNFKISKKLLKLKSKLNSFNNQYNISGLNHSTKSLVIATIIQDITKPVLIVTPTIASALKFQIELSWLTEYPVKIFPSLESIPYDLAYNPAGIVYEQLDCLENFIGNEPAIIIAPAKNLLSTFLSPQDFESYSLKLKTGLEEDITVLNQKLINLGYSRVPVIMDPGEYSIRGDICDIYPISSPPVRMEFGFDEIESIRLIDIETQRSIKKIDELTVRPRYKIVLTDENRDNFVLTLEKLKLDLDQEINIEKRTLLEENITNLITLLTEFKYFEGVEYFSPFIHNNLTGLLEYLSSGNIVILDEVNEIQNQLAKGEAYLESEYTNGINTGRLIELLCLLHNKPQDINNSLNKYSRLTLSSVPSDILDNEIDIEFNYQFIPCFLGNLKKAAEFINDLSKQNYKIIINTEYIQRVLDVFSEYDCFPYHLNEEISNFDSSENIFITKLGLGESFILPDHKLAIITDTELFAKRQKRLTLSKKTSKRENLDFFLSPSDLHENDYVVHIRHGIGQFTQLQKIAIDNQQREYLTIEYFGKDKLYVPVDQINCLSRYRGVGETPPKLSKMGGADWDNIKTKATKAIENIAAELLNLYAQRAKVEGYIFDPDNNWQMEMEEAFEFVETPDQMQAIIDVKKDMLEPKPMDRLICGDVGYGKTEVAIRAIFKAALSGKQVAILVPTTILAQQHYNNIKDRFLPYPMNIGLLSRFRSPKEQKDTVNKLITGECDIVIGTHRLLQKDIQFKNIGLVVIDEEHRFGVKHKEKLKHLRSQVDVISMSATPIPRTLYMSLSGIRDLSLINTPPVNRSPIKTHVGEYNETLVKSAIMRELEREGQVYYVHNRVQSIDKVAFDLSQLIPHARIVVGHGQMDEKQLEKIMLEFSQYNYDILVCTTIIESGLDIPNVNTIIVEDADYMGLAQLYQLRGRVGRCDRQAYAYCLYKPQKVLTPEAKKRLMAIREFNTLGSGYQIALRDLEIRGVGNILGAQQHGNMIAVGFDLYCELLEDSVKKLKGLPVEKKSLPVVDINVTAYIPDTWIEDKEQKIVEYKRLAAVSSFRELSIIVDEWEDRFGKIPQEVLNLITVIRIRLLAAEIGFNLIREEKDCIRIFTNVESVLWFKFTRKIPSLAGSRTKWVKLPKTSLDGTATILVKYSEFNPQQLLHFLEELCSNFKNFLGENKGE